jgi:hypothetical protein
MEDVLRSLALQVLEDALVTRSRGALVPFVVTETAGSATLHRVPAGEEAARAWLAQLPAEVERAVLAYPGELERGGERFHVVWVEAHERGTRAAARIGQRYAPNGDREPQLLGELFDAGDVAPLLAGGR